MSDKEKQAKGKKGFVPPESPEKPEEVIIKLGYAPSGLPVKPKAEQPTPPPEKPEEEPANERPEPSTKPEEVIEEGYVPPPPPEKPEEQPRKGPPEKEN